MAIAQGTVETVTTRVISSASRVSTSIRPTRPKAEKHSKAEGGKAASNGDQESDSGHNKSDLDVNTKAYQENYLKVDMSQNVWAGIGGDGGDHNKAEGGDVHVKASIETATDSFNSHDYYHIDDSGMLVHG